MDELETSSNKNSSISVMRVTFPHAIVHGKCELHNRINIEMQAIVGS